MGNILKLVGFGLAIVGIGLALWLPWWHSDMLGYGSFDVSLHAAEYCVTGGECVSMKPGGMFGILAIMTLCYSVVALIMIAMGGFVPTLSNLPSRPMAGIGGVIYLMMAGLTYGTMDPPESISTMLQIETTFWFKAGIAGGTLAVISPFLGLIDKKPEVAPPRLYKVPDVKDLQESPPAASEEPAPPRPRSPSRAPMEPIAIDLDAAPESPAWAPAAEPVAPAPKLRFAIATAEVREDALVAISEDGRSRQLKWSQIGGAIARMLDDPNRTLLVDLVPPGTAPLRFLPSSQLTFASGKDIGDQREALRRLLAFARAMHPDLELEAATTDFLYKRTDLPTWSIDDLDRYDARYAR